MTHGRYLFQSILRISVPDAGTVRAEAVKGVVKLFTVGEYEGDLRSNIRMVPSVEQVPMISGWCGENRAW